MPLARCPHVIFYRLTRFTARIVQRRLTVPWVGLPNVLAGRFVVPEFLQEQATPENLAQAALNLFDDGETRRRIEHVFTGFVKALAVDTGKPQRLFKLRLWSGRLHCRKNNRHQEVH